MVVADSEALDCVIVGGGPAGLTAALYLARFGRNFIVIDAGDPRAAWIPTSHNIAFFPEGISGPDILARQRASAEKYGARIISGEVARLERKAGGQKTARKGSHGGFSVTARVDGAERAYNAAYVLLATGNKDIEPDLPDVEGAVRRGLLRYCPICDGYEASDRKIAVVGHGEGGLNEALFCLRTYSADVTLLTMGQPMNLDAEQERKAREGGVKIVEEPIGALTIENDRIKALRDRSGREHSFEVLYSALGLERRSQLALALGAESDEKRGLVVSEHYETSVPGLFAAGGVVFGLDQVVVAMGHAAVAATEIHNRIERQQAGDTGSG